MVEREGEALNETFSALGHGTRRAILERLTREQLTVSEIAEPFDVSLNAVSKHLRVLERAGLIDRTVRGRQHYFRVNAEPLREAAAWLVRYRRFWEDRLEALDSFLQEQDAENDR